jgi:serine/threonine-protein kinase
LTDLEELFVGGRPGDVLAGRYRVERVLGHGGMGVVVAAHHVQLDTKVAIKLLLPEMLRNHEAVERFMREARAAVKITSEHVARVYDVGALDSGAPYMVMEFLEGGDLAAWLKQRGPLPVELAIDFVLQACVAIAEAHGLGIVHRDLKPANLFCIRRPDGQFLIKVLDFGISKRTDGPGSSPAGMSVTKTAAIMGSPLYMSPEQMQSAKSADAQSDIWAMGIVLYELLCGRPPFAGEAITEIVVQVTTQQPPPLRTYRPEVSTGLEAVVLRCLEKNRQRRFRNVAELAAALVEFAPARARALVERITGTIHAAGLSVGAPNMPAATMPATAVWPEPAPGAGTALPVSSSTSPIPMTSHRTGAIVAVAVVGVVALGGLGVLFARNVGHREASVSASATASEPLRQAPSTTAAATAAAVSLTPPAADSTPAATTPIVVDAGQPASAPARASVRAAATTRPAATPAPPRQAPRTESCDPPYYFDARGNRAFKPECL